MLKTISTIPLEKRKLAAVSYIPLLGPVVLIGHRGDPFIYFHALQGSLLSLYLIAGYFIPIAGPYIALGLAGLAVAGFLHAVHGREYLIFGLGHFIRFVIKK